MSECRAGGAVGGGTSPGGRHVTGYVAVCEDGETRHPGVFATRRDADLWAWWGHCCTHTHEIRPVEIPEPAEATR